ncbi:MAG: hypothetical protein AAF639_17535 [Chloroflexota bacterium]
MMAVVIENYDVSSMGEMHVKVDRVFDIRINAKDAQQKVNQWLVDTIRSSNIGAEVPELGVFEV